MGRRSTRSRGELRSARSRARARRAASWLRPGPALLLAGLLASLLPKAAAAEAEDEVKAAFLFNFARYVEWPATAFANESAPIRLCLIAGSPFEQVVRETVSGRSVGSRPVAVEKVPDLDAAATCHLLFLDDGGTWPAPRVAERLATLAVFTISDEPGFAADGGIANFVLVDSKIRFEINPSAARQAGLKISSSLLRLAKLVGGGGDGS